MKYTLSTHMKQLLFAFFIATGSMLFGHVSHAAMIGTAQSGAWSDPSTWASGTVPEAGDTVTVKAKHTVIYDLSSTEIITLLRVEGTLEFSLTKNTVLTVDEMQIFGTFRIGESNNRLPKKYTARVQLDGLERSIMTMDGNIEIHGSSVSRTWTRLAKTAAEGSSTITLKKAVSWNKGDEVVIASTSYDPSEAERRAITGISSDQKTLTLSEPLEYNHYGEGRQFAEVGLLTHNIQFNGKEANTGGHIMFMGSGDVHIENAVFDLLGNYGQIAQYPLHFHIMGNQSGSYIKSVAITESANRCVTIHGTNGVLVQDVVAYNTKGHCYFLEDGVEKNNRFIHNLGVWTRDGATIPSDREPATFWITNPNNTYERNAAAGSEAFGFWFFFLDAPTGLSEDQDVQPNTTALKKFDKNTSHSNLSHGITLDGHGFGSVSFNPPKTALLTRVTSYKNVNNGIWMRGNNMELRRVTVMDNRVGIAFPATNVTLKKSTIIGVSATPSRNTFPFIRGYDFYDGPNAIEDITFKNFTDSAQQDRAAIGLQPNNPFYMSRDNQFARLTFKNVKEFAFQTPERNGEKGAVIYDAEHHRSLAPLHAFHQASGCNKNATWNLYVCDDVRYGKLSFFNGTNTAEPTSFRVTRLDTGASLDLAVEGNSKEGRFFMNVPEGKEFRISSGNSHQMRLMYEGEGVITVRVPFTRAPSRITEGKPYTYNQDPTYTHWSYDSARKEVVLKMRADKQYQFFTN